MNKEINKPKEVVVITEQDKTNNPTKSTKLPELIKYKNGILIGNTYITPFSLKNGTL